jgi:glutaminyl-tRNA synthetase
MTEPAEAPRLDFIREIVTADVGAGTPGSNDGRVATRFPPEPNGYLHIGHAKSICLNFGVARDFGGACNLRFDDTNPVTEDTEYVDSIQDDVRWLGFDWQDRLFYASDYFERLYECAVQLIRDGKAYVDSLTPDEIREYRGTLREPGRESPHRNRPAAENLDMFARMRAGEYADGAHVLRARIDMASPNVNMRDPILYRVRRAHHHRTGDAWCLYPMYDYAHPLSDAIEGITHSLCTLEFENNRELYDWVLAASETEARPQQIEFARLNLGYTVMSKRKLLRMVEERRVDGWDDPRMPTLAGLRRRGVTAESIRAFCDRIGVARANSMVDLGKLEFSIRDDLNRRAPRVMCVLRPLRVVLEDVPAGHAEEIEAPSFPPDVGKAGTRRVPFSRVVYIDRDDFKADPPPGFHRLAPGREVRLRYAGTIRCREVVTDSRSGEPLELRCTYRPGPGGDGATGGGGEGAVSGEVKGVVHWVSGEKSLACEVNLYDRLFSVEKPDESADFLASMNQRSVEALTGCRIEPSVLDAPAGSRFQFERLGYFCLESRGGAGGALVFNRVVALRDTGAPAASAPAAAPKKKNPKAETRPARKSRAEVRERMRERSPELVAKLERFTGELGLDREPAELLTGDLDLAAFFEAAVAAGARPASAANWVLNELIGQLGERPLDGLPFGGAQLGELVCLVDDGTISGAGGKEVLGEMLTSGGRAANIIERRSLRQMSDASAIEPLVDQVIAAHPDHVTRYRAGKTGLLGFLVGQVMKASGGAANPERVHELLRRKLDSSMA